MGVRARIERLMKNFLGSEVNKVIKVQKKKKKNCFG